MEITLFLTDTDMINEVMTESSNTLRLDGVSAEDAELFCKLAAKYDFTVAAFLSCEEE